MFRLSAKKISAASALLLCAGLAQAQTEPVSPLTAAPTSVALTYSLATDTPGAGQARSADAAMVSSGMSMNAIGGLHPLVGDLLKGRVKSRDDVTNGARLARLSSTNRYVAAFQIGTAR